MNVTRSFAVVATVGAVAIGTAAPASAEEMSGHFVDTSTDSKGVSTTADFYFTPCGDGCANVAKDTPSGPTSQAHLINGQWVMDFIDRDDCADGTKVEGALMVHMTWDPNSLAGTSQSTVLMPACGDSVGYTFTNNEQLTRAA
ncbi:hypothetical protein OQ968_17125 [Mycobacterium sp. 663a-19]|uniref:hypothetical protein n=1 Tax=Mycobacterium sp. 663a-19 TaxID=2986148 RepID=UPI002D1E9C05|nr:hypothetical protein [Mycobacterium sp. 663a-19]MEB3982984.1 hypothetical protein [Mycobacterium sp. 663a-19]